MSSGPQRRRRGRLLAWVAEIRNGEIAAMIAGRSIERHRLGHLAGVWSGDYNTSSPIDAATSAGTGLVRDGGRLAAFCGATGSNVLFFAPFR